MTLDAAIAHVQFCYPQVYYACHTRHLRKRSNAFRLSPRDSAVLVHLDETRPMTVSRLAWHMDLAASTISEAISRLERLGYVAKAAGGGRDRRQVSLVLTRRGVEAVRAGSVLETERLRSVLRRLSRRDLEKVVDGLDVLARACRPSIAEKRRWERKEAAR